MTLIFELNALQGIVGRFIFALGFINFPSENSIEFFLPE